MSIRALALLAAALALAVSGSFACGDGGNGKTPNQYSNELNRLLTGLTEARTTAQNEHLTDLQPNASLEDQVTAARGFLSDFRDAVGGFSSDLGELSPPGEVEEAHDELTQATREFMDTLSTLVERLDGVEEAADLDRLLNRFFPAAGIVQTACYGADDAAAAAGATVELNCALEEQAAP